MAKVKPMGDILLDLEVLLNEMVNSHELQKGDILALVSSWIDVHAPEAIEVYTEGGSPEFYYGYPRSKRK